MQLTIDFAAMSDQKDKHNEALVFDFGD